MKTFSQILLEKELEKGSISDDLAAAVAEFNGVDFQKYDKEQFRRGLEVEMEHAKTVNFDLSAVGKIVTDHLDEYPDYYDRLAKIETAE